MFAPALMCFFFGLDLELCPQFYIQFQEISLHLLQAKDLLDL